MNADSVDFTVRAGKIDVLKGADFPGLHPRKGTHLQTLFIKNEQFPGLDLTDKIRPYGVERACFRTDDPCIFELSQGKRPETSWILGGNHLLFRHQ